MTERYQVATKSSRQSGREGSAVLDFAVPANRIPLAAAPIDHLFADHVRIRIACDLLETLARRPTDAGRGLPEMLGRFFRQDFARHCDEEDNDFLPLLERRLAANDANGKSLNRLRAEHAADRKTLQLIVPLLDDLAAGGEIADLEAWRVAVESFTKSLRYQLDWEDVTVAGLVGSRLTEADCEELTARMIRRRGGAKG